MTPTIWIVLITQVCGLIGTGIVAYFQYRAKEQVTGLKAATEDNGVAIATVQTLVDGHTEKILASNEALKGEVINLQHSGAMTPSKLTEPDAPVTLDRGIVSTDK